MFRPIAICLLIFSLCTTPVLAADKKPALEEAPPIPAEVQIDPDQQAIADYWDTLTAEVVDPYLTPPSGSSMPKTSPSPLPGRWRRFRMPPGWSFYPRISLIFISSPSPGWNIAV